MTPSGRAMEETVFSGRVSRSRACRICSAVVRLHRLIMAMLGAPALVLFPATVPAAHAARTAIDCTVEAVAVYRMKPWVQGVGTLRCPDGKAVIMHVRVELYRDGAQVAVSEGTAPFPCQPPTTLISLTTHAAMRCVIGDTGVYHAIVTGKAIIPVGAPFEQTVTGPSRTITC
jgi:hypothetical protein